MWLEEKKKSARVKRNTNIFPTKKVYRRSIFGVNTGLQLPNICIGLVIEIKIEGRIQVWPIGAYNVR